MRRSLQSAPLLQAARTRAGLSQRELARRAGTAQSAVARIELGQTDPGVETLTRLLEAAGFEWRGELALRGVADTHMLEDVPRILALTPEERLEEVANLSRFEAAVRRV